MFLKSSGILLIALTVVVTVCTPTDSEPGDAGTEEDRAALFDYIFEATMARESFSPIKNERLNLDVEAAMRPFQEELIDADTQEKLYYALIRLSNSRRDRHLAVSPVEGGIRPESWSLEKSWSPEESMDTEASSGSGTDAPPVRSAPIRFAVDYGADVPFIFAGDFGADVNGVDVGDRLISVNERSFEKYEAALRPYIRHSTEEGYWWKLAERISEWHYRTPSTLLGESALFGLEKSDGSRYEIELSYLIPETIEWSGHGVPDYAGFDMIRDLQTFDLYVHETRPVILLDWYGFREDLVEDIDWLMEYAVGNGLLDSSVVVDATRSRGGSRGAYAVQRLSPKSFKTTFGNLRISDVIEEFVRERQESYRQQSITDAGTPETEDDGSWQIDWLENDVLDALERGDAYSTNVPFKSAHAPKDSDGILYPADVHFRGRLVVLLGPYGGSHLDQFASIVVDNEMGHVIGMPAGGYSNTWEWEETLTFERTGQPVAQYMWSIGHTIRPNGEILEGNPAEVDEFVAQTAENYDSYRDDLVVRALRHLESNR